MPPAVLLGALLALSVQHSDTATFADAATADLYARARVRHVRQDQVVQDYQARVHTRIEATAARRRFAPGMTLLAHETLARIAWRRPNDLKVVLDGVRTSMPVARLLRDLGAEVRAEVEDEVRRKVLLDRPWFIPRALGDSIRVMGTPELAAPHPLADGATQLYRYRVTDTVTIRTPGRAVRAARMRIEPKRSGPALVAGDFWFDLDTGDLVRMEAVFLGEYLWEQPKGNSPRDSARARAESRVASRYVSAAAALEYALVDQQHWMPHRQLLSFTGELPWFVNLTMLLRAVTTFSGYRMNGGVEFAFGAPPDSSHRREDGRLRRREVWRDGRERAATQRDGSDSARAAVGYYHAGPWRDGWWEVEVPPVDSLHAVQWDTLMVRAADPQAERAVGEALASLAALAEELPPEWVGRRRAGVAWEQLSDVVRFNRVQALSAGVGYEWRPGPKFVSVVATGRVGLGDVRPTGSLRVRRDGPSGRLDVMAFRELHEVEPWTNASSLGHSFNSLVTGHEYGDFYLATGGGIEYGVDRGPLRGTSLRASYERHRSVVAAFTGTLPGLWSDAALPANRPVADGDYARGRVVRVDRIGLARLESGVEGLMGGARVAGGRAWASVSLPFTVFDRTGRFSVRGAASRGHRLAQLVPRLGGLETVRGFDYGVRQAREAWAAQLDVALLPMAVLMPVAFVDVGDTFSGDPLISTGVGISLLGGFLRLNLAQPVRPVGPARIDMYFRAPR